MAEDPEEVLPEDRGTAGLRVEEVGAEEAVEEEHDLRRRERRDGNQDHARDDEVEPDEQRHLAERHALAPQAEDGGDQVDRRADRADAAHQETERPVVGAVATREDARGERRIREPADVRRRTAAVEALGPEEAEIEEQRTEERHPEGERVQSRERHVARADHERHEVVREAEQDRHADEEHHRRAVHGHHTVEDLRRDEMVLGHDELDPHDRRLDPGDEEEGQPGRDVHETETLVIDGHHPLVQRRERGRALGGSDGCERRIEHRHRSLYSSVAR